MSDTSDEKTSQGDGFRKALSRHGYGFHFAVMERIREVVNELRLSWTVEGSEIPVQVQGKDTHVDFVLRQLDGSAIIVAECKRANPALAYWCFARSSDYGSPDGRQGAPQIERLLLNDTHSVDPVELRTLKASGSGLYQVGIEVKTGISGDPAGSDKDAIANAVTQVFRGANGLANLIRKNPRFLRESRAADIYPVVFTTAELFTTEQELHTADLLTGAMPTLSDFQKRDWVWYQHNVSHSLLSDVRGRFIAESQPDIRRMLLAAHVRGAAVVSASGIKAFFGAITN